MKHRLLPALVIAFSLAACGRDEPNESVPETPPPTPSTTPGGTAAAPGAGTASMPSWFHVNGNNVDIDIVAGATADNNHWNFNGATNGAMTITVPQGAQVTVNFKNADPAMAHSIGVGPSTTPLPATPAPSPAIPGAITPNAADATKATKANEKASFSFVASQPGEYTLLCYVPGHALAGMWVKLSVGGTPGVTGAPNVPITMQ